jgi:uncharacterized protein YdeI (YjbR/CyaY-like superfamily)
MRTLYVKTRREWRAWLAKHATTSREIWLVYYKKDSAKPRIPYNDAVEEALCFGWIDSTTRKIDSERFAQRFTPRKPKSWWSAINIQRAKELIREKKMTAAGLAAFQSHKTMKVEAKPAELPKKLAKKFKAEPRAWENFNRFPPFYRHMTIGWVASAKKEETRFARLQKLIAFSVRNQRIKFM